MKPAPIIAAVCVTIAMTNLLLAFYGQAGIVAKASLLKEKATLEANVATLQEKSNQLLGMVDSMRDRTDRLAIAAHETGLLGDNEVRIRLIGRTERTRSQSPGKIIAVKIPKPVDTNILRLLGLLSGIMVGTAIYWATKEEKRPRLRRVRDQGIRVQTASLK